MLTDNGNVSYGNVPTCAQPSFKALVPTRWNADHQKWQYAAAMSTWASRGAASGSCGGVYEKWSPVSDSGQRGTGAAAVIKGVQAQLRLATS